ncbi:TOG array regulator of axonemal microtubules protein 2 [Aquarana catesbeiana]|uniref:TOG array regulator of axonemal microtubules protein 2 n=1 Tax=Aquarana catesbeiana TaxID=8400 RepID=UPI003CC95FD2
MTHNDYTAAKFRAPIAVYCGSVPKMKPGFASLRNGDSNLQLYGNRWAGADPAALQPSLSLQMKRSYLWGGDDLQTDILPPPLDLEGNSDPLFKNQRHKEVDSATLETARLKDKLKRKMSESYSARGAPTEFMNSVNTPLKPAVPRSASQRLMTVTKPVPPIQRSPTPRLGTPEEDSVPRNALENGDRVGGQTEKTSAITEEEYLSSLLSEYQEKDEVEEQRALCAKACRRSSKGNGSGKELSAQPLDLSPSAEAGGRGDGRTSTVVSQRPFLLLEHVTGSTQEESMRRGDNTRNTSNFVSQRPFLLLEHVTGSTSEESMRWGDNTRNTSN